MRTQQKILQRAHHSFLRAFELLPLNRIVSCVEVRNSDKSLVVIASPEEWVVWVEATCTRGGYDAKNIGTKKADGYDENLAPDLVTRMYCVSREIFKRK